MKKIIYITGLLAFFALTTACEQQDILRYDPNRAAIEFSPQTAADLAGDSITRTTFTFRSLPPGETETILSIPFNIVGFPAPIDRRAVITILPDSTTATANQFEIVSTIVPANSFQGQLRVRVRNDQGAAFEPVRIWFRTQPGGDFPYPSQGGPGFNNRILELTNGLVRPPEWNVGGPVERRLGTYSTAFYQLIIDATGIRRFPFSVAQPGFYLDANGMPAELDEDGRPIDPNAEVRVWTAGERWMIQVLITTAVEDFNRENYPDVLLHDDGNAVGEPVIVGKIY